MTTDIALEKEDREREKRFNEWLCYSLTEVEKEKKRNLGLQSSSPPVWVFNVAKFKDWFEANDDLSSHALWLSGTTGFGKSVLASYIIKEVELRFPSAPIPSFFCKDNEFLREAQQVMRTFLYYVTALSEEARICLRRIWEREKELKELPESDEEIKAFFKTVVAEVLQLISESTERIFFVIDGVNECPELPRKGVLTFLKLLQTIPIVRILVTCQRTPDIVSALYGFETAELHHGNNAANIEAYIEEQLVADPDLRDHFDYVKVDPFGFFRNRHNGMFLWVSTVLKYLQRADSDEDFEMILSEIPDTMSGLYQEGLVRLERDLNKKEKLWVQEIFNWVVVAQRDLGIDEMEVGMSISQQIRLSSIRRAKLWSIEKTLSRCGAFLRVTSPDPETDRKTVSIVHDSFTQFITNREECTNEFFVDRLAANSLVVRACLSYLSKERVIHRDDIYSAEKLKRRFDRDHPLFSYASLWWSDHLLEVYQTSGVDANSQTLTDAIREFYTADNFSTWIESVLVYANRGQTEDYSDVHLTTIVTTISDAVHWVRDVGLSVGPVVPAVENTLSTDEIRPLFEAKTSDMFRALGRIVARVWLTRDPKYEHESRSAFRILRNLRTRSIDSESFDDLLKDVENDVRVEAVMEWAQVESMDKTARWYINVGLAHRFGNDAMKEHDSAIQYLNLSLGCMDDPREKAAVFNALLECQADKYDSGGTLDDLNNSIESGRRAASLGELPMLARYIHMLTWALFRRFDKDHLMDDLEEWIELSRKLVSLASTELCDYHLFVNNLAVGLRRRYEVKNSGDDLTDAIEMKRKALGLVSEEKLSFADYATHLCDMLTIRYNISYCIEDLDELINIRKKLLELTPESHENYMIWHNDLVVVLARRLEYRVSTESVYSQDELAETILISQNLIGLTAEEDETFLDRVGLLCGILWHHIGYSEATKTPFQPINFDEAIEKVKKAVNGVSTDPAYGGELRQHLCNLVNVRTRHCREGLKSSPNGTIDFSDREELAAIYLSASKLDTVNSELRPMACWWLGDFDAAVNAFENGIRLNPDNQGVTSEKLLNQPCVCDDCESNEFKGIRYRCKSCFDFDLCTDCIASRGSPVGHNFEHEYLQIPRTDWKAQISENPESPKPFTAGLVTGPTLRD